MRTTEHTNHIATRMSHNNCPECRADCERRFVERSIWRYDHVPEYLAYVRPRLEHFREHGADSVDARVWRRKFRLAMHRRISLKVPVSGGRKWSDSYLSRLGQFRPIVARDKWPSEEYLRQFARKGACAL